MRSRFAKTVAAAVAVATLSGAGKPAAPTLPSANTPWFEARTGHFVLTSSLGERETRKIATELETFRAALEKILHQLRHDSIRPVSVYLFGRGERFERYDFGHSYAAGVFVARPTRNYLLVDGNATRPLETAYHEYVHHLVSENFVALPLWLSEGIALYYETFTVFGGQVEFGRNPLRYTRWLQARSWAPLRPILLATHESEAYANPHQTPYFYTQSWLTVNYLLTRQGEEWKRTKRFLSLVSEGVPSDEALETAFETPLDKLERKLQIYAQGPIYQFHVYSTDQLDAGAPPIVRRLDHEEVLIRLGRLLAEAPYDEEVALAAKYFERAKESRARDVELIVGEGMVELRGDRHAAAAAAFRRAIEIDPENEEPYYYLGSTLTDWYEHDDGRVVPSGDAMPELIRDARAAFEGALNLDGAFVQAYDGLCRTYLFGGDSPRPGIETAKTVLERAPSLHLSVTLMELHARAGDRDAARRVYETHLVPLRTTLAGHTEADSTVRWEWIEAAAFHSEMIVAQAWMEQGKLEETRALLVKVREGAPAGRHAVIDAAIADVESQIRAPSEAQDAAAEEQDGVGNDLP